MTVLHVVVPADIDDLTRPSGGNVYDRRLIDALRATGRQVVEHQTSDVAGALAALPDGALVLVDGLLASESLVAEATRLRIVVLLHMLAGDALERAVLSSVAAVITTSHWGRDQALARYGLAPERVHVAVPGTDRAPHAHGTTAGGALLCVGAVAAHKGQDVLVRALTSLRELAWTCTFVGSLEREPKFVARLQVEARAAGIGERISFTGPLAGTALDETYARADLLIHPSRGEMYGMVVAEALTRGLPVIASDVGGVREALGGAGVLVPVDDATALTSALRDWLSSAQDRAALQCAARAREPLPTWARTALQVSDAVSRV